MRAWVNWKGGPWHLVDSASTVIKPVNRAPVACGYEPPSDWNAAHADDPEESKACYLCWKMKGWWHQ